METSKALPVAGIRIVTIALNLPGPLAVERLATEGANVIRDRAPVR